MFRSALLLALVCVVAVNCQFSTFPTDLLPQATSVVGALCGSAPFGTAPWQRTIFKQYTSSFGGNTAVCYLSEAAVPCATFTGAQACNTYNQVCQSISSDVAYNNPAIHSDIIAVMNARPEVCVSQGAFLHPDTIVFTIVLIIVGWCILLALLIYVLVAFRSLHPGLFLNVLLVLSFFLGTVLLFSYYYLNGILCLGSMYVAYVLFATRRSDCSGFAFVVLLASMLWTMHGSALGWVQQTSRLSGAATTQSVNACINYYRGYFAIPSALFGDFDNPVFNSKQICKAEWLGAELFFMILFQLVFVLAAVAGSSNRSVSHSTVAKEHELDRTEEQAAEN